MKFSNLYFELLDLLFPRTSSVRWQEISYDDLRDRRAVRTIDSCGALALLPYRDEVIRELMWVMKYRNQQKIGALFGKILAEHVTQTNIAETNDFLIPIPLSKKRRRERGFNQSEVIAKVCSKRIPNLPTLPKILIRTRENEHQARLSKAEREKNIVGVFAVTDPSQISGKRILLLDDIVTTGSTMQEAKRELIASGAQEVTCIAIAH